VDSTVEWRNRTVALLPADFGFEGTLATLLLDTNSNKAGTACRRLRLSVEETRHVTWLVAHQSALAGAGNQPRSRHFPVLAHPLAGELIAIQRARSKAEGYSTDTADTCDTLLRTTPRDVLDPQPLLTGDDLTAAGYQPGPEYKGWLERVRAAQLDGEVTTKAEALALVARLRGPGHG
jgi:poly(A) polymerase